MTNEHRRYEIRHNLLELMAKKNIESLAELSRETGIYYGTLRNFYKGYSGKFNTDTVVSLCEYFDCDIEDLFRLVERERTIS